MEETNLKEKETEEKMKNTDGNNKEIKVKESNKKKKIIIGHADIVQWQNLSFPS